MWPVTIVETREFLRQAAATFSAEELEALKLYLAVNARAGAVIPGGGGIRKLRWGAGGKGKRGGARVIYFFHNEATPLFLLSAYSKTRRADLSQSDRSEFRRLARKLVASYREGTRNDRGRR